MGCQRPTPGAEGEAAAEAAAQHGHAQSKALTNFAMTLIPAHCLDVMGCQRQHYVPKTTRAKLYFLCKCMQQREVADAVLVIQADHINFLKKRKSLDYTQTGQRQGCKLRGRTCSSHRWHCQRSWAAPA